jgi:DNA-binding CsgD family transcriptional regulator
MATRILSQNGARLLQALYLGLALFLALAGIGGMLRVLPEVNQTFGGFIWVHDTYGGLSVASEIPSHWPGLEQGLRGADRILAIDGQGPMSFPLVYENKKVGETAAYLLERGGKQLTVLVPVSRFTAERFFGFYGLIFITGLSCLLAGYVLIRDPQEQALRLLAFMLLAIASAAFYHGYSGSVQRFYYNQPALLLLWVPSYPVASALLIHFTLIFFPRPILLLQRHPWLVRLPYGGALAVMLFYWATFLPGGGSFRNSAFYTFLSTLAVAALISLVCPLVGLLRPGREGRGWAQVLGFAWMLGAVLVFGICIVPNFIQGTPEIIDEFLIPLSITYPVLFVYGVKLSQAAIQRQVKQEAQKALAVGWESPAQREVSASGVATLRREAQGAKLGVESSVQKQVAAGEVDPLTRREVEVLNWLALGLMDREIAETLSISERTVHKHVENIRAKLGVRSRAAAVVEARRRGLLKIRKNTDDKKEVEE